MPSANEIAAKLTEPQRRALQAGWQYDAFDPPSIDAHGPVIGALRRRGLCAGRKPHLRLTELGVEVARQING